MSFKYPGNSGDSYALRNVSFKIGAGQLCVLVGFNGSGETSHLNFQSIIAEEHSGKSTLLKLLNRLYDPTEGCILIDGHDIKSLKLADLRHCMSVLFQDYTHFPLSVCRLQFLSSS